MTDQEKRFHAACAAMQGILAWEKGAWKSGDIAEMACNYADALLARLAETEPKCEHKNKDIASSSAEQILGGGDYCRDCGAQL